MINLWTTFSSLSVVRITRDMPAWTFSRVKAIWPVPALRRTLDASAESFDPDKSYSDTLSTRGSCRVNAIGRSAVKGGVRIYTALDYRTIRGSGFLQCWLLNRSYIVAKL